MHTYVKLALDIKAVTFAVHNYLLEKAPTNKEGQKINKFKDEVEFIDVKMQTAIRVSYDKSPVQIIFDLYFIIL